jgi:squalene-hopene/tetraprenyl-beta-curcumene cyclase
MPDQVELDRGPGAEFSHALDEVIEQARTRLAREQRSDGHWAYELEADATIPAEYIILNHFLGEVDDTREAKLARYLRRRQLTGGGWPLYHDGEANISASVKAYFALKLTGDPIDAPHMQRAREAILRMGGLQGCNVFTRITLAFFGIVPWHATPLTRVEIMFAPRWFPMHIDKISYWSRTVMIPLLVLTARKARALNPRGVRLDELMPRQRSKQHWHLQNPTGRWPGRLLIALDRMARPFEPLIPDALTERAIAKAMAWVSERLNGEDGLGGIFPAMANALMAFHVLGYPAHDPRVIVAQQAVEKLITEHDDEAYCQPCLSPVWDSGLAALAMVEAERGPSDRTRQACDWLVAREVTDVVGDWASTRPDVAPSGWAFQYRNDHYPDVDDTAVVVMALQRIDERAYQDPINRAVDWVVAMQSNNGGWGAFDADNTHTALNHIPFADHGALLDPPTVDVTARCIGMLVQLGYDRSHPAVHRGIEFLKREQEPNGSWFGRWGTNYIYGTWSALSALNAAGEDPSAPYIMRAADWLESKQQADGGWGESCDTYWHERVDAGVPPLPSQTAWALLALMAVGRLESETVRRGIEFLIRSFDHNVGWQDEHYNAVGFPRVFYLKYHGYAKYFPLFALARYRNLKLGNVKRTPFGL